jgi:membrane glycosyltransferase
MSESLTRTESQTASQRFESAYPAAARRRRLVLPLLVLAPTALATRLMFDVLDGGGLSGLEGALVALFAVLFAGVSFGFWTVMAGLSVKLRGGDRFDLGREQVPTPDPLPPTALVMPIFHEDVDRVFAGLRTVHRSLAETGRIEDFHFFILSDSNDPNVWLREQQAWFDFCRETNGFGRIFYRRRRIAINRKSGGIADFCRRWGRAYRYLVVLDADSVMTGASLVKLVSLMEAHPRAGIIQTVPAPAGAQSLHARIQQFAQRLYGPLYAAGLNHWQLAEASYWGHNAILRVAPFMEHCALPRLSGRGPLSGSLLSHDFVEAAWMRRAGYQVWLAPSLPGSFEELPPTLLDSLKRDRRWCQGNLQHARLVLAPGLHGVQRLNLLLGIVAYAMAPLWLAFLVLSTVLVANSGGAVLRRPTFAMLFRRGHGEPISDTALGLFLLTVFLLLSPKLIAWGTAMLERARRRSFGGAVKLTASLLLETLYSACMAPILMVFHSGFLATTLLGFRVTWRAQRRAGEETSLHEALIRHGLHTLLAVGWAGLAAWVAPGLFWWLAPVWLPLMLAAPLSLVGSRVRFGALARRAGLFLTPEETSPPAELAALSVHESDEAEVDAIARAVVDPYASALHAYAGKRRPGADVTRVARLAKLRRRALARGPSALSPAELRLLLSDSDSLLALHREVWRLAGRPDLPEAWRGPLAAYRAASA